MAKQPLVIKLGGALIDEPGVRAELVGKLKALHASGQRFVLVHGGGKAVDAQLAKLGLKSEKRNGLRVTPKEHIEQIVGVLAGQMNAQLCASLLDSGIPAVGLSLADGGTTYAEALPELGFVGRVKPGNAALLSVLLASGFVPVLSSIAQGEGECLNVNADDAAEAVASLLGAQALVLLTDVAGVLDGRGQCLPRLDRSAIDQLIAAGTIKGGMTPKVLAAHKASAISGAPVLITHWRRADALAGLRQGQAMGTLIVA
ncbi:MAG: acetylglutamate kinase [Gammaproteobacteria bacterium]|nr:acetylglutamate kinase [Gammaproteobacteria bacterium]